MIGNKHLSEINKNSYKDALIQAETQVVFWLEDKGKGYLWGREGE